MVNLEINPVTPFIGAEIKNIDLTTVENITSKNRGVKQAGFHVLIGASMPNVLVEVGFISNPTEANLLGKSQYRRNIAKSMYNAIEEYKKKYEQK